MGKWINNKINFGHITEVYRCTSLFLGWDCEFFPWFSIQFWRGVHDVGICGKVLNIILSKVGSINQIINLDKVKYRKLDLHNVHSFTFRGNHYCVVSNSCTWVLANGYRHAHSPCINNCFYLNKPKHTTCIWNVTYFHMSLFQHRGIP